MTLQQLAAFTLFSLVAAITPGPANSVLAVTGAAAGVLRGLPCLAGLSAGMAAMMFASALGLGATVLQHPLLLIALKIAGAAFLLWLAWKIASASVDGDISQPPQRVIGVTRAFVFQWINPKAWLVCTGAAGTYLRPGTSAATQAVWTGATFLVVSLLCGLVWLAFGAAARRALARPAFQRRFNVAMGVLLAGSVMLLLV